MQVPICEVCLKSSMLCNACQEKLDSGKITQSELDVIRHLYDMSDRIKTLSDVKIVKVIDAGLMVIVAGKGDGARLVGKSGVVVKDLAKKFGKSIRVLEEADDFKGFVENLISPVTISGVNTLFSSGEEIMRVRVPEKQKNRLNMTPEMFSNVISDVFNKKAELIFEN